MLKIAGFNLFVYKYKNKFFLYIVAKKIAPLPPHLPHILNVK